MLKKLFISLSMLLWLVSSFGQNNLALSLGTPTQPEKYVQNVLQLFEIPLDSVQIISTQETKRFEVFYGIQDTLPQLLFRPGFIENLDKLVIIEEYWITLGIILHQVAHLKLGHQFERGKSSPEMILAADHWCGGALYKLGATSYEAQIWIKSRYTEADKPKNVKKGDRIKKLKEGYLKAKLESSQNQFITKTEYVQPEGKGTSFLVVDKDGNTYAYRTLADKKRWLTENLRVEIAGSNCYDDIEDNCRLYGRLYNWEAAKTACESLGDGWRLPTDREWRRLSKKYESDSELGDIKTGSQDAYRALMKGGESKLNLLLGGRRNENGSYSFLGISGDYWSKTESSLENAWYYHFDSELTGRMYRYDLGKGGGRSCRCINSN